MGPEEQAEYLFSRIGWRKRILQAKGKVMDLKFYQPKNMIITSNFFSRCKS